MTFALATLVFLVTLWLLAVLAAQVLEESGGKILAALKGHSTQPALRTVAVRVRHAPRQQRPLRASPRLRAAA